MPPAVLLIIGIGTRKRNGIDVADEICEIDEVELVASIFRSYIPSCTSPPVQGVQVSPVISNDRRGVILIDVPQGQARPHMSKAPDHHTYYRRVIDSFLPMESYEVEEMMRLKGSPKLELITEFVNGGSIGGNRRIFLNFGLRNVSRTTAKFPYIEYLRSEGGPREAEYGIDGNGRNLWPKVPIASTNGGVLFAAGMDLVIHPDQALMVSRIEMDETYDPRFSRWAISGLDEGEFIDFHFRFGCEDFLQRSKIFSYNKKDLIEILNSL